MTDSQTGTTSYTYDPQGNVATRNSAVNYTFDYGNRLRAVSGEEGSYAYDGYGRRVQQKDSSGGTINSFYDHNGQLIYQQGRDGSAYDYLYLQGHLVAIRDYNASGVAVRMRYQDTDALGSVIRQTDSSGNQYPYNGAGPVYDPWGQQIGGLVQDGPGYTGHVMDTSTNLIYMQQRYYDPTVMRALSMDPVDASNADGSNLDRYWYANDNPYRYTDPTGMCTGTHICNSDGTAVSTGAYTTGVSAEPLAMAQKRVNAASGTSVTVGSGGEGAPKLGNTQAPNNIERSGNTYSSPGDAALASGDNSYGKGVETHSEFQTGIVSVAGGYDYILPIYAASGVNIVNASEFANAISAHFTLVAWDHGHWDDVLGFSQRDMLQVYQNPKLPLYLTNRNDKTYLLNIQILRRAALGSGANNIQSFIEQNQELQGQPVQ